MTAIRFGLIGCGRFGSHHAQAIVNTEDAELIAVAARSEETCAKVRSTFPSVDATTDYQKLLDRADLDVVDVVLPTHLHFEVGRAVLESGRHLFLEKPMAATLDHCRQLVHLAETYEKVLAVGFKRRVAHLWRKVKDLIDSGAIGRPQYAVFSLWRWPYRPGSQGWRYDIRRVGSWILEEPVHSFDKARWYLASLGEPESIFAAANARRPDHSELHDNFSAILRFPQGAHVIVTQTLSAFGHYHEAKLTGTEGALWAKWSGARDSDLQPTSSLHYVRGDEIQEVPLPPPTGELFELEQEMAMMVRAVRDGQPPVATGLDGAWSVGLAEAAHRSIETGRVVPVEKPV